MQNFLKDFSWNLFCFVFLSRPLFSVYLTFHGLIDWMECKIYNNIKWNHFVHHSPFTKICIRLCCWHGILYSAQNQRNVDYFDYNVCFVLTFGKLDLIRHWTLTLHTHTRRFFFLFVFTLMNFGYVSLNFRLFSTNYIQFVHIRFNCGVFIILLYLFNQTKIEWHWNEPMSSFGYMLVARCLCPLFKMLYSSSFRVYSFIHLIWK